MLYHVSLMRLPLFPQSISQLFLDYVYIRFGYICCCPHYYFTLFIIIHCNQAVMAPFISIKETALLHTPIPIAVDVCPFYLSVFQVEIIKTIVKGRPLS